jgi:hypothetical protein
MEPGDVDARELLEQELTRLRRRLKRLTKRS